MNISNPVTSTPSRTAKHYSKRHERRVKCQRIEECSSALSWLEDTGLTPVKVVVMNNETMQPESIVLQRDIERALNAG